MRRTERNRKEVISRLSFGNTGLNGNLFRMGTGGCGFCYQGETVEHVLLFCYKYSLERRELLSWLQENKLQLNIQDILGKKNLLMIIFVI